MNTAVHGLLTAFEQLTLDEQREFVREIVLRTRELDYPLLDYETIDRIANESFLEYDAREAVDGDS